MGAPNTQQTGWTAAHSRPAGDRAGAPARSALALQGDLRRLERLLSGYDWYSRSVFAPARARARERAAQALETGATGAELKRAALLAAATDLLLSVWERLVDAPEDATGLVARIEEATGISKLALGRTILRSPELLSAEPRRALAAQLTMLRAFAPLRSVSVWTAAEDGHAQCLCQVGDGVTRRARQLAQHSMSEGVANGRDRCARSPFIVAATDGACPPAAVLVGAAMASSRERCRPFVADALPLIAALVERLRVSSSQAESERTLVQASERKLARLGFDLHDGPIQNVAMLADDVRRFGAQVEGLLDAPQERTLVHGRVEDLEAQITAIDGELRRLAGEVQAASVLLDKPFERALRDRTDAFTARTGIAPRVDLDGSADGLTTSQQIALLNILQEALNNIREHAQATEVRVSVTVGEERIGLEIIDNGRGFDFEQTMVRAGREGRIGLVAMNERVRLLGGECRISSRVGGPTRVRVALERWRPPTGNGNGAAPA